MANATKAAQPPKNKDRKDAVQSGTELSPPAANAGDTAAGDQGDNRVSPDAADDQAGNPATAEPPADAASAEAEADAGTEVNNGPQPGIDTHQAHACFQVLAPFWFRGGVIKPPAYIQMDVTEVLPYQEAGVLGTEPTQVPDAD